MRYPQLQELWSAATVRDLAPQSPLPFQPVMSRSPDVEEDVIGRRRPDAEWGTLPDDLRPGDYWKLLNSAGEPLHSDHLGNLTGTVWAFKAPGNGYGVGRLVNHTVREHEDGTISVRPGDGSSNSILVYGARGRRWHGYIEHGSWREVA